MTTRFTYADGSQRVYHIPLYQPAAHISSFLQAHWRYGGGFWVSDLIFHEN